MNLSYEPPSFPKFMIVHCTFGYEANNAALMPLDNLALKISTSYKNNRSSGFTRQHLGISADFISIKVSRNYLLLKSGSTIFL